MVSMVDPKQAENSDDLLVVESPSLRERLSEPEFFDRSLLTAPPSFAKRASSAFVRYLIACCLGVAVALAWHSYGDTAKRVVATWADQHAWPMPWLPRPGATQSYSSSRPEASEAAPAMQAPPETAPAPAAASSSDLAQVRKMTLGLAFTLNTLQERIEQLAAAQLQTANDVSKLQAAEQEIRRSLSTLNQRPAAAARSKPKTPVAPAPPTEPH